MHSMMEALARGFQSKDLALAARPEAGYIPTQSKVKYIKVQEYGVIIRIKVCNRYKLRMIHRYTDTP